MLYANVYIFNRWRSNHPIFKKDTLLLDSSGFVFLLCSKESYGKFDKTRCNFVFLYTSIAHLVRPKEKENSNVERDFRRKLLEEN